MTILGQVLAASFGSVLGTGVALTAYVLWDAYLNEDERETRDRFEKARDDYERRTKMNYATHKAALGLSIDIPGDSAKYQKTRIPGWDVIGTVTTSDGVTGALAHHVTGDIYCQVNDDDIKLISQAAVHDEFIKLETLNNKQDACH